MRQLNKQLIAGFVQKRARVPPIIHVPTENLHCLILIETISTRHFAILITTVIH